MTTPPAGGRRLLAPMVLGAVLNPINSSIIAVALVPIGRALDAPATQTAWLISALYLATAVGQPAAGRLVDVHGPRRVFLAGAALVGLGGVIGMSAGGVWTLVAARVVLGLGTCAGYPAAMHLIRHHGDLRMGASPSGLLSVLAVSSQTVAVIGPTLGGLLIGAAGWRATFAVNVPLALLSGAAGWWALPRAPRDGGGAHADLDLPGTGLFALSLAALLLFLMEPATAHAWMLLVAGGAGVAFVLRERRVPDPFVDVRVLSGNLALVGTYLRQLLSGLMMYAVLYGFSQWLEEGRGLAPTSAGLLLLPLSASALVASATTGRRPEVRAKLVVGAALQAVGGALLLALGASTPIALLVLVVVCFGIPQGLLSLGNQNALYHQADPDRLASSAGLLRTFSYLGAIGASATTGALFGARADTAGVHALGLLLVGCALALLGLTVADRGLSRIGSPVATS